MPGVLLQPWELRRESTSNEREQTCIRPDNTSGGGEFFFTSGGRDYEDQT